MIKQSQDQIVENIKKDFRIQSHNCSSCCKGKKSHYKELFLQIEKKGSRTWIDGEIMEIKNMQLDRYADIEIVVDKLVVSEGETLDYLTLLLLKRGQTLYVIDEDNNSKFYSKSLVDPDTGISYEEPSPNSFSFNSPYGWCDSVKA